MSKTIADKMEFKEDAIVIFIEAPEGIIEELGLPKVNKMEELTTNFDYIHLFVKKEAELMKKLPPLKQYLKLRGTLWVSWPKAGQLNTDLNIKKIIRIGYDVGLVESKVISINPIWSAIKFTFPKKGKMYHNLYGTLKKN